MKIEHLIVQHLYTSKQVTLQGIGTIFLNPSVVLPAENDKEPTLPDNAFTFEYNLKATEDDALINHIVQQTRKIKPLAASDLESYAMLAKQFLNIGKPLSIEGVGTIYKTQEGTYEFRQGSYAPPRVEEAPRQLKEKTEEAAVSFDSEVPKPEGSKKFLVIASILLFAALAGLGAYYFLFKNKPAQNTEQTTLPTDQPAQDTITRTDTTHSALPDSAAAVKAADSSQVKDSITFRIALKSYSSESAATKGLKALSSYGYKVELVKIDSTHYKLAIPYTLPLADTARLRDSLNRTFPGTTSVLLNKK